MKIHPLWLICILARLSIICIIRYINSNTSQYNNYISAFLFVIGIGFIFKKYTSSNEEIQIAKVFWHETRCIHGILFLLSSYYIHINNLNMTTILLLLDLGLSFLYRGITNK